jgi:hypothetical protein
MARIEIQIASDKLLHAFQQLFTPDLYAQCFIIPVPHLVLDRLVAGNIGPAHLSADGSGSSLMIPIQISVSLVKQGDVVAANGGPPNPGIIPPSITGYIELSVVGTTLTATYGGIDDTPQTPGYGGYQALFQTVVDEVGEMNAETLFAGWKAEILANYTSTGPLLQYDLTAGLPQGIPGLQFSGRSALSANQTQIAIRLEVGSVGQPGDGDWKGFIDGTVQLEDLLQGADWGMFFSSDTVVRMVDSALAPALSQVGTGSPTIQSNWAPQGQTAAVKSAASLTWYQSLQDPSTGQMLYAGDLTVQVAATTTFTLDSGWDYFTNVLQKYLRIDVTYNGKVTAGQNMATSTESEVAQGLLSAFLDTLTGQLTNLTPSGYTPVGNNEFYSDTLIPTQNLENELTMQASRVIGLRDGMLINGPATVSSGLSAPDCNVNVNNQFVLEMIMSCQGLINTVAVGGGGKLTPQEVNEAVGAVASFSVAESSGTGQFPLVVGAFQLVGSIPADMPGSSPDPQYQFSSPASSPYSVTSPYLHATPVTIGSGTTFSPRIPLSAIITPGYTQDPYPLQLIMCTNGGARYVDLGTIPTPQYDLTTGAVTNFTIDYIHNCVLGELAPWTVMLGVFQWLGDPSPDGSVEHGQAVAKSLAEVLIKLRAGQSSVVVMDGIQIGAVSVGTLTAGQRTPGAAGATAAAESAAAFVAGLFQQAARLQPPNLRGQGVL